MSWPVHNGFKPIIDCITVHNNLYNNDWNDSEYTLTLFANIFYNTVTFNTVTDHTNVPLYTLTLSTSNLYYTCNWIHLDHTPVPILHLDLICQQPLLHLYLHTSWPPYLSPEIIVLLFQGIHLLVEFLWEFHLMFLGDLSSGLYHLFHLWFQFAHCTVEFLQGVCCHQFRTAFESTHDK